VAVAGSKKKKSKSGSGWTWRLAGLALCAFFVLGVLTGLSQSGRMLARRIEALLHRLPHSSRSDLLPAAYQALFLNGSTVEDYRPRSASTIGEWTETIALVEHPGGFYQLDSTGRLAGPVAPDATFDLPILSGNGIENARPAQLLEYAGELIRAEAVLSAVVSELRITAGDEIRLYLVRPHLAIVLASGHLPLQLARAARVLQIFQGHRQFSATIDMTIPGEAVVRPKAQTIDGQERVGPVGRPG
jgi:hypothetical protein